MKRGLIVFVMTLLASAAQAGEKYLCDMTGDLIGSQLVLDIDEKAGKATVFDREFNKQPFKVRFEKRKSNIIKLTWEYSSRNRYDVFHFWYKATLRKDTGQISINILLDPSGDYTDRSFGARGRCKRVK